MRPLTLSHKCIQPPLSSHFDSMSQELASQNQHEEDSRDMTYMLSPVRCRLADKRAKTLAPEGAWGWGHTWASAPQAEEASAMHSTAMTQ